MLKARVKSRAQEGSEHLEEPAATLATREPLPADCDGEIDWTLFTFSHGFRQPRTAHSAAAGATPEMGVATDTALASGGSSRRPTAYYKRGWHGSERS